MTSADEFEAAGLYDPVAHAGTSRLELLTWLESKGVSIEEMVDGDAVGVLAPLASDQRLRGGEILGKAAALERSGLDETLFDQYVTALGFTRMDWSPDESPGFTSLEAAMLGIFGEMTSMFTHEDALAFVRVIGAVFGRLGEAAVSMFLADVETRMLASGLEEFEMAKTGYEAIGLVEGFPDVLEPVFRRHLMQANARSRLATIAEDERLQYRYAIGFVDLVGFTERSAAMAPRDLARFIRQFESRAQDVVTAAGARIVKLIGDEVMFTGHDTNSVCRAASDLTEGFLDGDEAVVPRGGVAIGNVVTQGGDYFGPAVNLASRLVDAAVPQEILVTADVAEAAAECSFEPAGRRVVKGFADPIAVFSLVSG